MDDYILISWLNDFIFCPVSIYFHQLYGGKDTLLYQNSDQLSGKAAHKTVDEKCYSTRKDVLQGVSVISEKYGLVGKIDIFDVTKGMLTERKKRIVKIYDGYVFQLYAQYFALMEMGYMVTKIRFHSFDDNKNYNIRLPYDDNIIIQIKNNFEKKFSDEDSIMIMKLSKNCEITRFGYAKHDEEELIIV